MAFAEHECKSEYLELRRQCQKFSVDLLDQTRSSQELAIILNYDPENEDQEYKAGDHMTLKRLEMAINYKQKKVKSEVSWVSKTFLPKQVFAHFPNSLLLIPTFNSCWHHCGMKVIFVCSKCVRTKN